MSKQEPVSALAEFVKEHLDSCASTFLEDGLCTCGRNQALSELKDYELRLDLLTKGATWEHEENARLNEVISLLQEERDAWKRSSELYERESNHWYKKVLEQDVRLEAAEALVTKWQAEIVETESSERYDKYDPELNQHLGDLAYFADELEAALQIVKDDEK